MPIQFGPFVLNEQTRELLRQGDRIALQPQVFDVLAYLISNRNRVVGKEELLNTLWPDVIVTDASLQRTISLIRTALRPGGCADAIQTRARLGYRFSMDETQTDQKAITAIAEPFREDAGPLLLERESFLEELNRRFRRAQTGEGQTVLLSGEAGIGKSALLAAFLSGVPKEIPILRGYCDALFTPRAFGAILDVAAQLPGDEKTVRPDRSRERAFGQLYRRLGELVRGSVVVLEDLHWADEATLDFVRFFSRRIASTRCLLLASYRDDEGGASRLLNRAMGEISSPQVSRLRLLPLTAGAVDKLAGEVGQKSERIFTLTGGNPFLVHELLSSPASEVPETVRDSMLARLARCSDAARQVCHLVALFPGRAELDLVTQVLGEGAEAIDEPVARGVILHENGALTYRHELARRAVENLLAPAASRSWHARILTVMRAHHTDIARQVHHARCAGDRAAVLALAPEAAKRAAALGAHREASAHYLAALTFVAELSLKDQIELFEQHAYECYVTGEFEGAVESATAALKRTRELNDLAGQGRILRFLSRQYWFLGDRAKAETLGIEAIQALVTLPPGRDLAMAYSNRSQLGMLEHNRADALEYGEKAVALARVLQDVEVECHALNNIGTVKVTMGDLSGSVELERSLQLALSKDLHEHVARAYVNLSSSSQTQQNVRVARRYLQEGIAYCEERDLEAWTRYLRGSKTRFDFDRGDWEQAGAAAALLLQDARITAVTRVPALVVLGQMNLRKGLPGVTGLLDEALALALPTGEVQRIGPAAIARAEAAWFRQDWAAVTREADQGLTSALPVRDAWTTGELLFWKSMVGPTPKVPAWVAAPYRLAIAGDWLSAAAGFSEFERPYERAIMLARGDAIAGARAHQILNQLGAHGTLAALAQIGKNSKAKTQAKKSRVPE